MTTGMMITVKIISPFPNNPTLLYQLLRANKANKKPITDKMTPLNKNESFPNNMVTYDANPRKNSTVESFPRILYIAVSPLIHTRKTYTVLPQNIQIPLL
jgi:hypothetical protein